MPNSSARWPASIMRATPVVPTRIAGASGLWTTDEALRANAGTIWPVYGNSTFTKVLLHFDGADASTTMTDSNLGGAAKTWTASGNAQLDTGISPKFGTASLLLDGTGDYIRTADSSDFTLGSNDFTIDLWFYVSGGNGTFRYLGGQSNASVDNGISVLIRLSNTNVAQALLSSNGTSLSSVTGTTAITTTGWHHLALVRTSGTVKLFVDGTQEGGDLSFASAFDSSNQWGIGCGGELNSNTWNGLIDEFRLVNGHAQWTANFTPPTYAYGP